MFNSVKKYTYIVKNIKQHGVIWLLTSKNENDTISVATSRLHGFSIFFCV